MLQRFSLGHKLNIVLVVLENYYLVVLNSSFIIFILRFYPK